ncbi:MAG: amino acid permease [Aridibacter famidurans]|nr:amino acid permease [Aridibacter famidurans]
MAENLKRQFGLWTASALIVGQVIAVGIFLTPAGMAKSVQSPFWLFAIWIVIGLATLCGALSYAELTARFPEAGGPYVFLREAYGKATAFLFGWVVLLVIDPGLTAIFSVGLAGYFSYIVPMTQPAQTALAIATVVAVGMINIRGARLGAGVLNVLIVLKIGSLLALIVIGFLGGFGDWGNFDPFFAAPPDWTAALIGGSVGAYFAFAGWWEVSRIAGEVEEPSKNLPKALAIGVGTITVIYTLTSAVFYYLVPVEKVGDETTFAAQAGAALFGALGGKVFAALVVISVLGTIFAYLMASPRLYFAMAKDGLFFPSFGKLHEKWETPHRATLIQMALACLLIVSGSFDQIVSYFFFVAIVFIMIIVGGLFAIDRTDKSGYVTPLFPLTPVIFILVTGFVAAMLLLRDPVQSLLGVGIVLVGIPVYLIVFRRS